MIVFKLKYKYDKILKVNGVLKMSEILRNLNEEQYEAVTSFDKYLRVIAGAGSGKTRVLTCRIANLIENMGVLPYSILAITFTNKAAAEMRKRVDNMLKDSDEGAGYTITTFHSFCARFLREEIHHIGYTRSFTIVDEDDQLKIVKDIIKELDITDEIKPKHCVSYISYVKTLNISYDELAKKHHLTEEEKIKSKIYLKYEEYLTTNQYVDFDDLLLKTVDILKRFPLVRKKWMEKYEHILVDEFQDTNDIQYELLTLLLSEHCSLFVVGDPDQTIYTWRGANVDLIMDFKKRFKPSRDIVLNQNYRSTKHILNCANELIKNNKKRVEKDLITNNIEGAKVIHYQANSIESEADWVVQRIKELMNKNEDLAYSDFAILYRSNYYSRAFEQTLVNYKIPYVVYGGMKFFDRKEVKDSLAYLRLALQENDTLAFERIINVPRRGIGDKAMQSIKDGAKEKGISLYRYVKDYMSTNFRLKSFVDAVENCKKKLENPNEQNLGDVLKELMSKVGYIDYLTEAKEEERIDNIHELAGYIFSLQSTNEELDLVSVIQEISLASAQDEMTDSNVVTLMTVHTAKGLEYPFVFVVGLSDGVFPSSRSIMGDNGFVESKDAIEEERRLAYVAFTRAQKQLLLSHNEGFSYASGGYLKASRFIIEIGGCITPYYKPKPKVSIYDDPKPRLNKKVEYKSQSVLKDNNTDYRPGDLVNHSAYGSGIILSVELNSVRIAFKDPNVGQKVISKKFTGLKKV